MSRPGMLDPHTNPRVSLAQGYEGVGGVVCET
jgi:hypothetical protein